MPHLRGKIDYYELATPLSTEFFCWYQKGEIYGLDHDPKRFEQTQQHGDRRNQFKFTMQKPNAHLIIGLKKKLAGSTDFLQ